MKRGRPLKYELKLTQLEQETLEQLGRSRSEAAGLVRRAQGLLLANEGRTNDQIAAQLNVTAASVSYWRKRFGEAGLAGLYDLPKSGRPRTHDDERVAVLLKKALAERPAQATHWSVRQLAAQTGISKSSVQRYFALFGVQPHRSKSFKLSSDPLFVEKVRDIVGLYLNPPDKALVLCVDEKSQIQALERTQPVLPMGLGYVEGVTHDYYRHGTTTLFAALEVGTGQVITQCKPRHRHQEFLAFLRHLDRSVPAPLELHLIIDNYATHKQPQGSRLARATPPLPRSLHSDFCFLAKSGRTLVRPHHPAIHPPRLLHHRQATHPADRGLRPPLQPAPSPLCLDCHRRLHPRQARALF